MTLRTTLSILLVTLLAPSAIAETAALRDILMDGDSRDFAADEALFTDSEELDFDSWWGENNDINQVKLTWDDTQLYIAIDGRCWDNNMMVFFDTDSTRGIRNQDLLNAWGRKLEFVERLPEYFLGTWDRGTWPDAPQLWELEQGATQTVRQVPNTAFSGASLFSQGQTGVSMEAAIPWSILYPGIDDVVPEHAELAVVAVVVTSSDNNSGPDSAPNNVLGMPQNAGDFAIIDNFAILRIDQDGNGEPDRGVAPALRVEEGGPLSFLHPPDAPPKELKFVKLRALRDAFSPNGDGVEDEAEVSFKLSTTNFVTVTVHDMQGHKVLTLADEARYEGEEDHLLSWQGRDAEGRLVETGIYYLRFEAGRSERQNLPVAVLR